MATKKFPLEILIGALDRATAPLKKINRQIEGLRKPVARLQRAFNKLGRAVGLARLRRSLVSVGRGIRGVSASFGTMLRRSRGMVVVLAALGVGIGFFAKRAGDMEQVEVAFTTLLKSGKKAQALIEDITNFAAKTPFSLVGLFSTTKQLIGMGIESSDIISTLQKLGDVSAGLSVPMDQLALAFGKVKSQGRLTGLELLQFMKAGVPILDVLAKMGNTTKEEIRKLVSKGVIRFQHVEEAFRRMTSGAGKFSGMMIEQSKTFLGLMSIAGDALDILSIEIGNHLLPVLKPLVAGFINFVNTNREMLAQNIGGFFADIAKKIPKAITFIRDNFGKWKKDIEGVVSFLQRLHKAIGLGRLALAALAGYIFGPLLLSLALLSKALIGLSATILSTPLGLFLVGLTGIVVAGKAIADNWRFIKSVFAEAIDFMSSKIDAFLGKVTKLSSLIPLVGRVFSAIGGSVGGFSSPKSANRTIVPDSPGGRNRDSKVTVRFEGTPKGTRVERDRSSGPVDLDVGYQFGGVGVAIP